MAITKTTKTVDFGDTIRVTWTWVCDTEEEAKSVKDYNPIDSEYQDDEGHIVLVCVYWTN